MIVRYEILRVDESYSRIVEVDLRESKDGVIAEYRYSLHLPENGLDFLNWGSGVNDLCELLNDGLRYRQQFKESSD